MNLLQKAGRHRDALPHSDFFADFELKTNKQKNIYRYIFYEVKKILGLKIYNINTLKNDQISKVKNILSSAFGVVDFNWKNSCRRELQQDSYHCLATWS